MGFNSAFKGLRSRIFSTFGTTRVVGRQPYAPAAFTPGEIPGTHFERLNRPQGTWFPSEPRKKSPATQPGIDPGTVRLVTQCLNHYATLGHTVLRNYIILTRNFMVSSYCGLIQTHFNYKCYMSGWCENGNEPSALSEELSVLKKGTDPWSYLY